jgi:hypothetical protein
MSQLRRNTNSADSPIAATRKGAIDSQRKRPRNSFTKLFELIPPNLGRSSASKSVKNRLQLGGVVGPGCLVAGFQRGNLPFERFIKWD